MCGLFGYITTSNAPALSREEMQGCLSVIGHRGPDASGIETFTSERSTGALGHVRLSIIDLAGGKQPMSSGDGNVLLSFNGEIYNYLSLRDELIELGYSFSDHSDTEVLLNAYLAWGKDCVKHLRGMFAFAFWDSREECLFIARDHFGKKPLFYMEYEGALYFASEIKALQAIPKVSLHFNSSQMRNYSIYRYVPDEQTFIREIKKLPAGSSLFWQKGQFQIARYFQPMAETEKSGKRSEKTIVEGFWKILGESVRLRMNADVPFGAFLSGGIDSSAIVALMSQHSPESVKTFSIGFSEREYSELEYAAVIARQFNTDHHEIVVSEDDLIQMLPEVVRFRDAPVCEPSDIPIYLLSLAASKQVKMILTGEGSDEMLGGYPKHVFERFVPLFHLLPRILRRKIILPGLHLLPYRYRRIKTALRNMDNECFSERMPGWFGALSPKDADDLLLLKGQAKLPDCLYSEKLSVLQNILLFDQMSWLPDNLLERGDRMTMAASIEARMPFMDVELSRYVANLPQKYLVRRMKTKWILRKAMETVLPREILNRPKVGFRVPVNIWFQTTMKDYLLDHLMGESSITNKFYDSGKLKTIVNDHLQGRQNHEKTLWMLLVLEIWLRQNQHKICI